MEVVVEEKWETLGRFLMSVMIVLYTLMCACYLSLLPANVLVFNELRTLTERVVTRPIPYFPLFPVCQCESWTSIPICQVGISLARKGVLCARVEVEWYVMCISLFWNVNLSTSDVWSIELYFSFFIIGLYWIVYFGRVARWAVISGVWSLSLLVSFFVFIRYRDLI